MTSVPIFILSFVFKVENHWIWSQKIVLSRNHDSKQVPLIGRKEKIEKTLHRVFTSPDEIPGNGFRNCLKDSMDLPWFHKCIFRISTAKLKEKNPEKSIDSLYCSFCAFWQHGIYFSLSFSEIWVLNDGRDSKALPNSDTHAVMQMWKCKVMG